MDLNKKDIMQIVVGVIGFFSLLLFDYFSNSTYSILHTPVVSKMGYYQTTQHLTVERLLTKEE